MILVDTSVIVAWMDPSHPEHRVCSQALDFWAGRDHLAVSSVTHAELANAACDWCSAGLSVSLLRLLCHHS
jgi:predicted nucleic acid-binding protein